MKKCFTSFSFIIILFAFQSLHAQSYFVPAAQSYVNGNSFDLNTDASTYEGKYEGASETFESNYIFEIKNNNGKLNIVATYSYTQDGGDTWTTEAYKFDNVTVDNGYFYIGLNGNEQFTFVTASYKPYKSKKKVNRYGILMQEFKMFSERTE